MSRNYYYSIPSIVCGACAGTIEQALKDAKTLDKAEFAVDTLNKALSITFEHDDISYQEALDLLNHILSDDYGHECLPIEQADGNEDTLWAGMLSEDTYHLVLGIIGITVGAIFLVTPLLFTTMPFWMMLGIGIVSVPLTLFLGADAYLNAFKKIRVGVLTMDSLFSISTLTVMVMSCLSFFYSSFSMMFEAGLLIFGFSHIGRLIDSTFRQMGSTAKRFQDEAPQYVMRYAKDGLTLEKIRVIDLEIGDEIQLEKGDMLPVDGTFQSNEARVVDSIVTGSLTPRTYASGELLYAGTRLAQATIPMRYKVSAPFSKSLLVQLDILVTRTKLEKSQLETRTATILQYFIPSVAVIACVCGILVGVFISVPLGFQCAASILVSACPCTLGLIIPLAFDVGKKRAENEGVRFNRSEQLESGNQVDCMVFDLNGTLTEGAPRVVRYHALEGSGLTDDAFLGLMAHLEKSSQHPIAKAICEAAKTCDVVYTEAPKVEEHFAGLVATFENKHYFLGSESLMRDEKITVYPLRVTIADGESLVYLAREGQLIGYIILHDDLRPDAIQAIHQLQAMEIPSYICTGSPQKTALRYAKRLGIPPERVFSDCVVHAKADSQFSKKALIEKLISQGLRPGAVGDGDNDALMLRACYFPIAIQSSASSIQIMQDAFVVISLNTLMPVVKALRIAQQTVANIEQNLIFSLLYNVLCALVFGCLLLALGVVVHPALGALLMIIQSSLILFNVYLFSRQTVTCDLMSDVQHEYNNADDSYCVISDTFHQHAVESKPVSHASPEVFVSEEIAALEEELSEQDDVKAEPNRVGGHANALPTLRFS